MQPSLEDDMEFYKESIQQFQNNLIEYRAHLVHKHSEANYDREEYAELHDIEVVVISDYKMKVLASKYREAQQGK